MKTILITALMLFQAGFACAEGPAPCATRAQQSKLAGPALKAFMIKCERDAKSACDASAKDKNLDGAALVPFMTTCMNNSVGE